MKERSPCYECELANKDKNNEQCRKCEKRIAYARRNRLISNETSNDVDKRTLNNAFEKGSTIQEIDENFMRVMKDIKEMEKLEEAFPRRKKVGRHPSPNKGKDGRYQVYLRFPAEHADICKDLISISQKECRTVSMQALYFIKKGMDNYKENRNE